MCEKSSNIRTFVPSERRLSVVETEKTWCKHLQVTLDEEARTVNCRSCDRQLDPFTYLVLLKNEWKHRAYRDDQAKKAYAALDQAHKEAQAKGRIFTKPADGAGRRAWDVFAQYLGKEPFSIYRRGRTWYVAEENGWRFSEDYCAMELRSAGVKQNR